LLSNPTLSSLEYVETISINQANNISIGFWISQTNEFTPLSTAYTTDTIKLSLKDLNELSGPDPTKYPLQSAINGNQNEDIYLLLDDTNSESDSYVFKFQNPKKQRNNLYVSVPIQFPYFILHVNDYNNKIRFNNVPNIFEIIPYYKQTEIGYKTYVFSESQRGQIDKIHISITDQKGEKLPEALSHERGLNWWLFEIRRTQIKDHLWQQEQSLLP
tara:strand:- start:1848 stop:2495 length:648 start_codon:yes stop_codon:yes gene_type:complete